MKLKNRPLIRQRTNDQNTKAKTKTHKHIQETQTLTDIKGKWIKSKAMTRGDVKLTAKHLRQETTK